MAKKATRRTKTLSNMMDEQGSTSGESSQRDYKTMIRELASNPAVRYVAGGLATAILSRVATNLSTRYPEISRFISENLEGIEGRLGEFKNSLNNDQMNQQH